jgi:uncharacterized protein (TIRG00374 family)
VLIGYIIYNQVPDWGKAWHVMIGASPLLILFALCFVTLHMTLRAARWGVLLRPAKHPISFRNLFVLTLVKYVINVVPPRAGEVAASAVLAKKENIPTATVIAASLLERILDVITVLCIFAFYLFFFSHHYVPNTDRGREIMIQVRTYSIEGFIAICVVFAVVSLLLRRMHWADRIPVRIRRTFLQALEGFRALQSRARVIEVVFLSFAIWLAITMQIWCLVQAYLGSFPFTGALLLMAMTVVGVSIPTPGGVGGFQFFMNLTLVNFFAGYMSDQDLNSQAAGISNGTYIVSMIPVIVVGLILLNKEGLSLGRISRMSGQNSVGSNNPPQSLL